MDLDDDETRGDPHQNFLVIMDTVKHLDDNGVMDDEWISKHTDLILKYRRWIPNYTFVNDEVTDKTFRKRCADMEVLINHLCNSINASGKFDLRIYHIFMKNMKAILEYLFAEDILEDAMNMLALK